jgi:hypothetical protein
MSNGDDTELGIEAITEDMEPKKKRAAARLLRRNSMVAKAILWVTITLITGILGAVALMFTGLINIMGGE